MGLEGDKEDFHIYKSLASKEDAQNLSKGNIILRSWSYYLTCVDPLEFTITRKSGMSSLANEALIFCCHKNKPSDQTCLVTINHPFQLFKEISCILSPALFSSGEYFGEVRYEDMNPENPGDFEVQPVTFYNGVYNSAQDGGIVNNPGVECAYYKDRTRFFHEDEVRMCFLICPEKLSTISDNRLKVTFSRRIINQTAIKWEIEEIDYAIWKGSKADWRNYWFEVSMKVDPNNFTYE